MQNKIETRLRELEESGQMGLLKGIKRGFEKESLRVTADSSNLATTPHPQGLGSSLMHPQITTDYSEALLEFITPPTESIPALFQCLEELHQYTISVLDKEYLWLASMPCKLPEKEMDIPIARYGRSHIGRIKHIYRKGLNLRYGGMMQTIAGIHYNFSLPMTFWENYQAEKGGTLPLKTFISEGYLALIRNSLRFEGLLPLLFGASPVVCGSFVKGEIKALTKLGEGSFLAKSGTSLRLSNLGYHNKTQANLPISYNSYSAYLDTMHQAVHTTVAQYQALGLKDKKGEYQQLSACLLQIEDEHYSMIRPKRVTKLEERMLGAIAREGIEYIEVRCLDINPLLPLGIEENTVYFLDTYLIFCLLLESPPINDAEWKQIQYNHNRVVMRGRNPTLSIYDQTQAKEYLLLDWAKEVLNAMLPVAEKLDTVYGVSHHTTACRSALEQLNNLENLPSARILKEITNNKESYCDFTSRWSLKHAAEFKTKALTSERLQVYKKMAEESIVAQEALEANETRPFEGFLKTYLED